VPIDKSGFIYIYTANETDDPAVNAYFDDLKITHKQMVVQADDYYPFGLSIEALSYQRFGGKGNDFLYNSFELQSDLDLGLYDYLTRFYDPVLGRFINIDPAADLMRRHSPYNYAFDNPLRFIDPDGMMPTQSTDCPDGCDEEDSQQQEQQQQEQNQNENKDNRSLLEKFAGGKGGLNIFTGIRQIIFGHEAVANGEGDLKEGDAVLEIGNENEVREDGIILVGEGDNGVKELTKAKNTEEVNADDLSREKNIADGLGFEKNTDSDPSPNGFKESKVYSGLEFNLDRTHPDSIEYRDPKTSKTTKVHQRDVLKKKPIEF